MKNLFTARYYYGFYFYGKGLVCCGQTGGA